MKTRAAVLHEVGKDFEVTELDLDPPKAGEVLRSLLHKATDQLADVIAE